MTEREKIVEVMARGQYATNCWWRPVEDDDDATGRYKAGHDGDLFRAIEWEQLCEDERKELLDAASAALTALEASGMAVVPVKASETMELAGYVCLDRTNPYGLDVVKNIWAAMLSAASPTPSMTENADE